MKDLLLLVLCMFCLGIVAALYYVWPPLIVLCPVCAYWVVRLFR